MISAFVSPINPKGSHSPIAVMDLDWFLSILAKALDLSENP
jgi:hypothetical protein